MELFVDTSANSLLAELVARYTGLEASGAVRVILLSENARTLLNIAKLPALCTAEGFIGETYTVLRFLGNAAKLSNVLEGASAEEKAQVDQWLAFAFDKFASTHKLDKDAFQFLNDHLLPRVFMVSSHVTLADLALFVAVYNHVKKMSEGDRLRLCNVTRWFDHVQHMPGVLAAVPALAKIEINKNSPLTATLASSSSSSSSSAAPAAAAEAPKENKKAEQKGKKQEKPAAPAAAPAAGGAEESKEGEKKFANRKEQNKEKKEKKKEAAAAAPPKPEEPTQSELSKVALRVGQIVRCWKHPKADKLYCEEIDLGEGKLRNIASGLAPYIPLEEMQNRRVVVMANLKPRPLVGFESHGMVLCASNEERTQFELITPPEGAQLGERVMFEGHPGEAEPELNPKKKTLENVLPGFKVNADNKVCTWNGVPMMTSAGPVTVTKVIGPIS